MNKGNSMTKEQAEQKAQEIIEELLKLGEVFKPCVVFCKGKWLYSAKKVRKDHSVIEVTLSDQKDLNSIYYAGVFDYFDSIHNYEEKALPVVQGKGSTVLEALQNARKKEITYIQERAEVLNIEIDDMSDKLLSLKKALQQCVNALDNLMGDSDLIEGDTSPEFLAMQNAVNVLLES